MNSYTKTTSKDLVKVLDKSLLYVKENSKFKDLEETVELTEDERKYLDRAFYYLQKHHYVTIDVTKTENHTSNKVLITYEGLMLLASGGFEGKLKRESNQATLQSWQTWAIVLGTLLAGLYGLQEILKAFHIICVS